ncbi:transcriptional regulator, Sir2 family domain-containing protein [Theileria equi strain WA]|uniref:protein acetyllysine N-acetyltransferase n=1 Tax=Theileria equi strain WA TaxID=1537102 RepID=L0B0Q8_THEEQ|nr:transcriptional regulator, Sir2 family domain-containing protein [Theileria equi strain WA]AFZ80846.1 transcriptional regulator, Sir2 family domain-containing protein [Theileria equi strain WA]|eukprot:XP_004830512.1 transcriptional regulator, Sir2 family domain-containing protein [Theileria equi strain WA]
MVNSALMYASRLKKNDNKGPLGTLQLFDTPTDVHKKCNYLFQLLSASDNAILHTGAGVSTGAGIPDFRGPSGVWTIMKKQSKKKRSVTESDCVFRTNSKLSVTYGRKRKEAVEFVLALPSEAHLAILELLKAGVVKFIITQNIDGLHPLSGVRFSQLAELHGNVFTERCISCGRRYQRPYVAPTISFRFTGETCGICSFPPSGVLTDVVLDWFDKYEEHYENKAVEVSRAADLHVSLGTSLHIEPACHYASIDYYRNPDSPLVIVNFQKTKLDPEANEVIHSDVNKLFISLLKRFKLNLEVYLRKVILSVVKYEENGNCVLLIRLPSILKVRLESNDPVNLRHECLSSTQGIHKFTFCLPFTLILTLWYDTQVTIHVPYERVPLFKGEVWEICIAATDGRRAKNSERVIQCDEMGVDLLRIIEMKVYFNSHFIPEKPCKLLAFMDLIDTTPYDFINFPLPNSLIILAYFWGTPGVRNVSKMHYPNALIKSMFPELVSDNKYGVADYIFKNESGKPSVEYKHPVVPKAQNPFSMDSSLSVDPEISMDPTRMENVQAGYPVGTIKSEYQQGAFGMYPSAVPETREQSAPMDMRWPLDKPLYAMDTFNIRNRRGTKTGVKRGRPKKIAEDPETVKMRRNDFNDPNTYANPYTGDLFTTELTEEARAMDVGDPVVVGAPSKNPSDGPDSSNSTTPIKEHFVSAALSVGSSAGSSCSASQDTCITNTCSLDTLTSIDGSVASASNASFTDDTPSNADLSSFGVKPDGDYGTTPKKRTTKKKKSESGKKKKDMNAMLQLFKISGCIELAMRMAGDLGLASLKTSQISPNLQRLQVEKFTHALESSLPLKLYISKEHQLGELVDSVPYEVRSSLSRKGKIISNSRLSGNVNSFEVLFYQVISSSLNFSHVNNYVLIKSFAHQLPLWLLKHIADLFECR